MTEKRKEFLEGLSVNPNNQTSTKETNGDKVFALMHASATSRQKYAEAKTPAEKAEAQKLIDKSKEMARE